MNETPELTWDFLLAAYASGYFPMAQSRDDAEIGWFDPDMRGILPLEAFHIPRSLAKIVRKNPFTITTNQVFPQVMQACAQVTDSRKETWINGTIFNLYCQLWEKGFAHSVECWQGGELVGGLYGVALGGAFFGESMFSRAPNASKIALVVLVQKLTEAGYSLLDAQYTNAHLQQFGIVEITRDDYLQRLETALQQSPEDCF